MLRNIHTEKHLQFWISQDVCVRKKKTTISTESGSDTERYYIFLEQYGKYWLSVDSCFIEGDVCAGQYIDELYARTVEGDRFYLIYTDEQNPRVAFIIPESEWELSAAEFVERDGRIISAL